MNTLPAITGQRLVKALRKTGFEVISKKGSHHFFSILTADVPQCQFIAGKQLVKGSWLKSFGIVRSQ